MKKSLMAVMALCVLAGHVAAHAQSPPEHSAPTQSVAVEQEIGKSISSGNVHVGYGAGIAALMHKSGCFKLGMTAWQQSGSTCRASLGIDPQSMIKTIFNYNTGLGTPMRRAVIEASGAAPPTTLVASN